MRVKLHLIAEIDVDPLPTQDPVELARIDLNAMREAVRPSTEWAVTLYEDSKASPEIFNTEERDDGVVIMRPQTQREIDEHIANDEFQCHLCNEWADIEDSIEHKGEYYCVDCCTKVSCGHMLPKHLVIFHEGITVCENCYDRIK